MLPDRSKRFVSNTGEVPRLNLANNWQLALITIMVSILLYLIFPSAKLIDQLNARESLDELSLSYIQNMYRADKRNVDIAVLLAKHRIGKAGIREIDAMLDPFKNSNDLRQRTQVRLTLMQAYHHALQTGFTETEVDDIKKSLTKLMLQGLEDNLPDALIRDLIKLAFRLEMPHLAEQYLSRFANKMTHSMLEQYGREALANQEYEHAANFFLMARDRATQIDDARRLFQLGIGTLMSDSLFKLAMTSADKHMGNLENDLETIRYMASTTLAAGEPVLAVRYARLLVFITSSPKVAP